MNKLSQKPLRPLALRLALATLVTATVVPAAQAQDISMSITRPRLVVLMHGVTSKPLEAPAEKINTGGHARWYWGMGLIKGAMGFPGESYTRVITPRADGSLRFKTVAWNDWRPEAYVKEADNELAPVLYPMSWLNGNLDAIASNQSEIKTFIKLMTKPGTNPHTAVMVTYRDGSKHLMPQTSQAINQIYDTYMKTFGHLNLDSQPQIYLVGHSFGGVVARAIMANPTGGDLWGNKLSANDRLKADFIRKRTVFITTMGTPHTGTHISDVAMDMAAFARKWGTTAGNAAASIDSIFKVPPFSWLGIELNLGKTVRTATTKVMNAISGERDCLLDLIRMPEYNTGILNPDTLRRSPTGSKVPLYTMSGRNPGGMFYDRTRAPFVIGGQWLPYSVIDLFSGDRFATDAFALYAINSVMHEFGYGKKGKMPWGATSVPELDQMISGLKGVGPANARPVSAPIDLKDAGMVGNVLWDVLKAKPYNFGADGEVDSDGFLGADSAHAYGLNGSFYRLYNKAEYGALMPWDMDNHGSMMFNPGIGSYIQNELIREAGPYYSTTQRLSRYLFQGAAVRPKHNVKVEVLEVNDSNNNLDTLSQADFSLYVKVGDKTTTQHGPNNVRTVKTFKPVFGEMPTSVIPIRISVIERDDTDPSDYVTVQPRKGRDNVYLYFDTRTQTIVGDGYFQAGDIYSFKAPITSTNSASIKVRITGQ